MGQARGRQTILECIITAFPQTVNYWEKDGRKLTSSAKYHVDVYDDGVHKIVLYVLYVIYTILISYVMRCDAVVIVLHCNCKVGTTMAGK